MNPRALRFILVALILAGAGTGAALLGRTHDTADPTVSPTASPSFECLKPGAREATPAWYPKDLPLPPGSYAVHYQFAAIKGYQQQVFVVNASLHDFVNFVLGRWPKEGWVLGRGDAEPGEAEDTFTKPREQRFGAFRASAGLCVENNTLVYIVLGRIPAPPVASPGASGRPLNPSPS